MKISFLFLLFVVKESHGFVVNVSYGVTDRMCEWSIRGPPFKEFPCSNDGCNNAVHTCLHGCTNGDPAADMDKKCYFNGVPVADQEMTISATMVEVLANITTSCNLRVPPCGGSDCFQVIDDSGSATQTCGYSCPIPFSMGNENTDTDANASACVLKECPNRIPANYFLTLVTGADLTFNGGSPNSAFVVKIADKKVFQSQVVMSDINPVINKGVNIGYGTSSVVIEVHNYNIESQSLDYIGGVTVVIGEVATEQPSSHNLIDNSGAGVGVIKLKRSSNARACGSSGWCKKAYESTCAYENCGQRMPEASASVPCGPECYQQVNFAGKLQTTCSPSCPRGYETHESGQCVVVIEPNVEESAGDKNGLIIVFGVVLPIMIVVGIVVVVVTLCILVRLSRKRSVGNSVK